MFSVSIHDLENHLSVLDEELREVHTLLDLLNGLSAADVMHTDQISLQVRYLKKEEERINARKKVLAHAVTEFIQAKKESQGTLNDALRVLRALEG
jgi:hypothetical protein